MDSNNDNKHSLSVFERLGIGILHITPDGLNSIRAAAREQAIKSIKRYNNHFCDCGCCKNHQT